MRLDRRVRIQLVIFAVVALVAGSIMVFGYMRAPANLFGVGQYQITIELPRAAGLYKTGNVTYRGTEVGRVTAVNLTDTGVSATLSLRSGVDIPSDVQAQVRSVSGIGEQYVALQPRSADSPPLKDGDVIPESSTTVPPDINSLLDAANRGLEAVPPDNLKTVVDESYTAVGGLGPEIARLVKGSTQVAIDARANLDPLLTLIDDGGPVLDSQVASADSIRGWAAHLADLSDQLKRNDDSFSGLLRNGGPAAKQARDLVERLQPTLPVLLANLVTIGDVGLTYQPAIEQLLVLVPQAVQNLQAAALPNRGSKHPGLFLDFNLNFNLPPPCTTGYLPIAQQRNAVFTDVPEPPAGDLYCRIPQDSPFAVRGARNYPCMTRPGKRAPTVEMCESDQEYVPLNDGYNWKGDPNATTTGQSVPQLSPSALAAAPAPPAALPPPPIAVAEYDPATGRYIGPDGKVYTQADLAETAKGRTWQDMLTPGS